MDHFPNFDPQQTYEVSVALKLVRRSKKSIEACKKEASWKAWTELIRVVPVEFRASIKQTFEINEELMIVKAYLTYKPLI